MALTSDTGSSSTDKITSATGLSGSGDVSATVTIKNGSTVLGTTTANSSGAWSYTPAGLIDGSYSLTASETDIAGNIGTATLGFTLDTTAPTVASVTASPSTADLGTGQSATITLNFSEAVIVGGTPTLTLSEGRKAHLNGNVR